ncbi:hypothetical protein L227DRAFT_616186 [Lentinus tigrinus ALCF2SS1-6]|uniref:Uncharacterized protein n=1 Tax=Lentinus tigrinus ALCF2SS1-6 TaxID=1328759 RepID=A0A5C2RUY8_9APHY|nr:hypothetical protein L227DRAFT_616186 [Lentinus tigrinus ALCF2SS1-6]
MSVRIAYMADDLWRARRSRSTTENSMVLSYHIDFLTRLFNIVPAYLRLEAQALVSSISKIDKERTSVSPHNVVARRHAHQASPSPARIPSSQKAALAPRAQVYRDKIEDMTSLTDPFTDAVDANKTSGNFCACPKLACQPSGKLPRRRQASSHLLDSPTPKVRSRHKPAKAGYGESTAPLQPAFNHGDETDTPPTTPIREVASVPPEAVAGAACQQESLFCDNAPHTAPLLSTYSFLPAPPPPSTPTPAQRRRNHQRIPSEGTWTKSSDQSSPSSSVVDLTEHLCRRSPVAIPRQHCQHCFTSPAGSRAYDVAPVLQFACASATSAVGGQFAGSVFQNVFWASGFRGLYTH